MDDKNVSEVRPLDAMKVASDNHEVFLENDYIRVLDARVAAGERTPVHTHQWPGVLYVMGWSDFIRFDADANILFDSHTMSTLEPGASLWSDALPPHYVHNIDGKELRVITIELKQAV